MKMMFKAIPLLAICAAAPAMATMTVNFDLDTATAVDWLGSAGDNNFANASNWSDNTVPVADTWRYAHFNLAVPTVVTNAFNDAYDAKFNLFGVVVEAGSAQLTIGKLSAPTSQASKMMRFYPATENRTAFVNYSDTHAIFDCYVNFSGYRDNDGRSGVHPGAEYNQELRMREKAGYTLVFFSGEPSWSDYRKTSVINKKIDCDENSVSNNIEIQVDHIVLLAEGSAAECADFTVDGTLVVSNATVTAKGSLSGNGEIVVAGNGGTISAASLPSKITLSPGFSLNGDNRLVTSFKLKVAKHDGLTVTADNFDIKPVGVTPAALDASIAEEGDYWIVTIAPSEFIPCKTGGVYGGAWDGGSTWNGNVACEAGRHYIVRSQNNASQNPDNRRLNSPDGDAGGAFPGDSLTLVADSGLCSYLALKGNAAYTFNRLNLGANGAVRFYLGATTVAGNIYVGSDTANEPASFGNSRETACTVSADIYGTGSLLIQPTDVNDTVKDFNLALSGDNSNFTGELVIKANTHGEVSARACVSISNGNALGGGRVTIDDSTLKVLDDITAAQTFKFSNSPAIEIAAGKTLSLAGEGSSGRVAVSGGTLKAANAYAAGGIEIASGTAELPSLSATAEELSARKFPAKDWLFVPGGSLESSAADNLALVTSKGWALPANYGLAGKWMTTLGQRAESVAGVEGVMLTVSGRARGYMVIIR